MSNTTETNFGAEEFARQKRVAGLVIQAPQLAERAIHIIGTAPYIQHAFSEKARATIEARQKAGSLGKKNTKREGKDFEQAYRDAMHVSVKGWCGIPAPSFRNAMISACRLVGFKMTLAKLSIFVLADGYDNNDATPLVKIEGEPEVHKAFVRNETGVVDLRWRPIWKEWTADVRIKWDARQFQFEDVVNLMAVAGAQVGIGEGRPDSPRSNGLGMGLWRVELQPAK